MKHEGNDGRVPEMQSEQHGLSRRSFLARSGVATGAVASANVLLSGTARGAPGPTGPTCVLINLRGGADGLSICCPYADTMYYTTRPTIRAHVPHVGSPYILDSRFVISSGGLSTTGPDMLLPYNNNDLCFVHGAGMMGQSRSHFSGMLNMEHGQIPSAGNSYPVDGWGGRYLGTFTNNAPVRSFGNGNLLPTVLRGGPKTSTIPDLANLGFPGPPLATATDREKHVKQAYQSTGRVLAKSAAAGAFDTITTLSGVNYPGTTLPAGYPNTTFGRQLANTAAVIKDPMVQVDVIHLDLGGWDHHADQAPHQVGGQMYDLLRELSTALGAFYNDMGGTNGVSSYVLMAYSEFGRQIAENNDKGTDHGYGGLMIAMGKGLKPVGSFGKGGTVFAEFGALSASLDPLHQDALKITVDYRDVVSEALVRQLCLPAASVGTVFPGFTARTTPTGIFV